MYLWGAGGHGKVVLDVVRLALAPEEMVFVDDDPARVGSFCGCPVRLFQSVVEEKATLPYGRASVVSEFSVVGQFIVSIGDNRTRAAKFVMAADHGFTPVTAVHPSAWVSCSAEVRCGTVVMPRVVINCDVVIGRDCIVNTAAVIEHDCVIGDHAHISPGAVLGGGVSVGAYAHVGLNASVLPGISIGEGSVVGAGAVVVKDVPAGVTVAGVPARIIRPKS
jgi:sugar O-acyltransferase (sialic acid O-acetyltransferase NeuD family)